MALKAGRVGVNPSQVDMAGNVIGGSSDTYTKLEIDQMMGSKVGIGQLEANNKDFYFAYDATTQKYGYKLDNTGDFHPFEEGGSGRAGWNRPADLITTGLTPTNCQIIDGGYYIDNGVCIIDICVKSTSSYSNKSISGFNIAKDYQIDCVYNGSTADIFDNYFAGVTGYAKTLIYTADNGSVPFGSNQDTYAHIWGEVPVVT